MTKKTQKAVPKDPMMAAKQEMKDFLTPSIEKVNGATKEYDHWVAGRRCVKGSEKEINLTRDCLRTLKDFFISVQNYTNG